MPKRNPRLAINVRLPRPLHARLVKAAKREGRSLNAEILARLAIRPQATERLMERLEHQFLHILRWAGSNVERNVEGAVQLAFSKLVRQIETGDMPTLLNERLAGASRDVIRDQVNQAVSVRLEGHRHEAEEGPPAQNGPAPSER